MDGLLPGALSDLHPDERASNALLPLATQRLKYSVDGLDLDQGRWLLAMEMPNEPGESEAYCLCRNIATLTSRFAH